VDARRDCADFVAHAFLRMLYQLDDERFPQALRERARATLLCFKYWPDEPGRDSLCTWTENHQILFASAALLAGQLFPDARFENAGDTGREKCAAALPRIRRWLDLRFRTGFSEWLSNCYYDEDLVALLSLVDFARDEEIRRRSAMVVDCLLLDMALGSYRGVFGASHGRSYERMKKCEAEEATTNTGWLLFGQGSFRAGEGMSAIHLALSPGYRMPRVLERIAADGGREEMLARQRMGIRVDEARRWGIGFEELEDGMALLSLEAYAHPRTFPLFVRMLDAYDWWHNDFFRGFRAARPAIERLRRLHGLRALARLFEWDLCRNTREEVHVLTRRTPDGLLSSAQDYRKGMGGDQQSIWQATLAPDAVCFTTHPAHRRDGETPDPWTGSATLPRVAQVGGVVIALYRIRRGPALYVPNRLLMTHAWLPQDRFDEVREEGGWIFARAGDGYLALRSQRPVAWRSEREGEPARELVAEGRRNVWICELGRRARDGSFPDFARRIAAAPLRFRRGGVSYRSPSQGLLELGWRGPLRRDGRPVELHGHPRYETPYGSAPFPAETIEMRHAGHWLRLEWEKGSRTCSDFA
jgi:hypothetical protein